MYTKKCAKFCEVCAHFSLASWYYINRKNPPIHYIVFATPHKKKYLLQKRQPNQLSFLLCLKQAFWLRLIKVDSRWTAPPLNTDSSVDHKKWSVLLFFSQIILYSIYEEIRRE